MIANTPEAWSERSQLEDPLAAAMWSAEGQQQRFVVVLKALVPVPGETLLDFGCGTGVLSRYVLPGVEYLGYDWSDQMVQRAQRDHPDSVFVSEFPDWSFDLIACIGTFNLPGKYRETWKTVDSLWERTNRALAVSLYAGYDPDCLGYDAYDLVDFAVDRAVRWRVEKHRHNDLILVLWR